MKSPQIGDPEMFEVDFDPFSDGELVATFSSTEAQREIWIAAEQGDESNCAFNESISLHFHGPLNIEAFNKAINQLVLRHESLHANFSADGATYCVVADAEVDVRIDDLSSMDESVKKQQLKEFLDADVEKPMDIQHGPLFRVHLVLLSETESYAIICAHHIICDGLSWAVLLPDLANFYRAATDNRPLTIGEAEKYSDYIHYLAGAEQKKHQQADLKYWLDVYADHIPQIEMPLDFPRPRLKTYAADRVDYSLNPDMVSELKKLGSANGATFVVTLMAAFKIFLHRITGQNDLVLGLMAAGQSVTGFNQLVGHCVNLLPVRSQLQGEMTFIEYAKTLRSIMFDAYDHQHVSFGTILKNLNISRDPSRVPLCPVTFNIDQAANGFPFGGLEADFITNKRHFENFELFLNAVEDEGNQLTLECTFNRDLFSIETIQRRLEEFECLIGSIIQSPEKALNTHSMIPASEQAILDSWNETAVELSEPALIHHLFEQTVEHHETDAAVIFNETSLSYKQLNERSNQLAHLLSDRGVKPDRLVGLAVERSEQMLVAMLGILKTGAAYVPLDVDYPEERLHYMIENSAIDLIVTQTQLEAQFSGQADCVCMDAETNELNNKPVSALDIKMGDESLAYVIYTSGSTGKPKGVQVPHRSVVNFLLSMARKPGLDADNRLMAVTTLSFDIAMLELLLPIVSGATMVIASREVATDGELLMESMAVHRINMMQATPATWRMLLDAGWTGNDSLKVLCGGEAFPVDLATDLLKNAGSVWNMYGPTETTIWSTCDEIRDAENTISIGRPIDNTRLYILNEARQLMPMGVQGELYIGGEGVVRGYLNNPVLTNDRFISLKGERIYQTGDIARFLDNGRLECLGRADNQVKLRGFRIELGEIETVLLSDSTVKEVVVDVKELSPGDKRLMAYLVINDGCEPDIENLRSVCQVELPEYMLPQHFIPLQKLPLTLNGKIDRNALPLDFKTAQPEDESIVEPVTVIEKNLSEIWCSVLKRDSISMTDNFFNLGGHSLLANQIITRIRKQLIISIPLTFLFEFPTLQLMADHLPLDEDESKTLMPPSIEKSLNPFPADLSMTQQRLWFLQQLYPDSALFNQVGVWKIHGDIDRAIFKKAVSELVNRQLILNTGFSQQDGSPSMVEKRSDRTFEEDNFHFSSEQAKEQELLKYIETKAEMPLDFDSGQLLKIQLIRLDKEVHVLLVISHPIIWDGWSFDILLKELSEIYGALLHLRPHNLAPLPVNYMDFPAWHKNWMESGIEKKQLEFWRTNLEGASTHIALPRDRARAGLPTYQGNRFSLFLEKDYVSRILDLAHQEGVTLYMVMLSAFYELLHKYSGQHDITIATQVQGRVRPEFDNILGPFVNTVLLRNTTEHPATPRQMIQRVRQTCVDAFNHQDVSFEKVLDLANLERTEKNSPPYQIMFTFQDTTNRSLQFGDFEMSQINHNVHTAYTDIIFWLKETGAGLYGGFDYSTELFDIDTINQLHDDYLKILDTVIANPDLIISIEHEKVKLKPEMASIDSESVSEIDETDDRADLNTDELTREKIELTLLAIWQKSLELDDIEPNDNFFELGGHSLSSMQVLEKIKVELGIQVPARAILMDSLDQIVNYCVQSSSVSTTVQHIDSTQSGADDSTGNSLAEDRQTLSKSIKSTFLKPLDFFKATKEGKTSTPIEKDQQAYEELFASSSDKNLFRGVYSQFDEAFGSAPESSQTGYNHAEPARMYKERLDQIYPADYPVIFWMERIFKESASTVFDFGGHIGIAYFSYQKYIDFPDEINWLVCDVEEVTLEGKRLAERKKLNNLGFSTEISKGDGRDIFFASGSLQYLENSLNNVLAEYKKLPRHLLINLLPVHDSQEYFTLQNIGFSFCPYHIFSSIEFIQSLQDLGYELIDGWQNPEKACLIPFHEEQSLEYYSGYYFKLTR